MAIEEIPLTTNSPEVAHIYAAMRLTLAATSFGNYVDRNQLLETQTKAFAAIFKAIGDAMDVPR